MLDDKDQLNSLTYLKEYKNKRRFVRKWEFNPLIITECRHVLLLFLMSTVVPFIFGDLKTIDSKRFNWLLPSEI